MESKTEFGLTRSDGFGPIANGHARVLILGTFPGAESLIRREYYAQRRNMFWRIIEEVVGISSSLPYEDRTRLLKERGIALWDVCAEVRRSGSLDSAIQISAVVPNDFSTFLDTHACLTRICFNGATAEKIYRRKVLPELPVTARELPYVVLPSTSPAHAAMPLHQKVSRWRIALSRR